MKKFLSSWFGKFLILLIFGVSAYFINVEGQSYFGRRTLDATGLERFKLNDGLEKAARENKKVLVDVSAIWCPTCRRLDREIFANENVKRIIQDKFVFVRLEYESAEGAEFLALRKTDGFPNLWILESDGRAVKQLRITFDESSFIDQLR